ncbi:hypothetical protein Mapa_002337 [Marchantia paleacea]|nr:hypothetical protein Mapa_002337 [Marchantia paleacea]
MNPKAQGQHDLSRCVTDRLTVYGIWFGRVFNLQPGSPRQIDSHPCSVERKARAGNFRAELLSRV